MLDNKDPFAAFGGHAVTTTPTSPTTPPVGGDDPFAKFGGHSVQAPVEDKPASVAESDLTPTDFGHSTDQSTYDPQTGIARTMGLDGKVSQQYIPPKTDDNSQLQKIPTPGESFGNKVYDIFKKGTNWLADNVSLPGTGLPASTLGVNLFPPSYKEDEQQRLNPRTTGASKGSEADFVNESEAYHGIGPRKEGVTKTKQPTNQLDEVSLVKKSIAAESSFPTMTSSMQDSHSSLDPATTDRLTKLGYEIKPAPTPEGYTVERVSPPTASPTEVGKWASDVTSGYDLKYQQLAKELSDAKTASTAANYRKQEADESDQKLLPTSQLRVFQTKDQTNEEAKNLYDTYTAKNKEMLDFLAEKDQVTSFYNSTYTAMKQRGFQPEAQIATKVMDKNSNYTDVAKELDGDTQQRKDFAGNLDKYHQYNGADIVNAGSLTNQIVAKDDITHVAGRAPLSRDVNAETIQSYVYHSAAGDITSLQSTVDRDKLILEQVKQSMDATRADGAQKKIPAEQIEKSLEDSGLKPLYYSLQSNIQARKDEITQDQSIIDAKTPDYKRYIAHQQNLTLLAQESPIGMALGTGVTGFFQRAHDSFATFGVETRHTIDKIPFLPASTYSELDNQSTIYRATHGLYTDKLTPEYKNADGEFKKLDQMEIGIADKSGMIHDFSGPAVAFQTSKMAVDMVPWAMTGAFIERNILAPGFNALLRGLKAGEFAAPAADVAANAGALSSGAEAATPTLANKIFTAGRLGTEYALKPATTVTLQYAVPGMMFMNSPDGIDHEMQKGLSFDQAVNVSTFRSFLESAVMAVAPEQMNTLKAAFIKGEIKDLAESEVYKTMIQTNYERMTGHSMSDNLYKFIYGTSQVGKNILRGTAAVSVQQDLALAMNHMTDLYVQGHMNSTYQKDYDLTSKKLLDNTITAFATMLPIEALHSYQGAKAVKESQMSALYNVAQSPERYSNRIQEALDNSEISQTEALRQTKIIKQADDIHSALKADYDIIDDNPAILAKKKESLKYELFKNKVDETGIVNKLTELEAKGISIDLPKSKSETGINEREENLQEYLERNVAKYQEIQTYLNYVKQMTPEQQRDYVYYQKLGNLNAMYQYNSTFAPKEPGKGLSSTQIDKVQSFISDLHEKAAKETDFRMVQAYGSAIQSMDLALANHEFQRKGNTDPTRLMFHIGSFADFVAKHDEQLKKAADISKVLNKDQQFLVEHYPNLVKSELNKRGIDSEWVKASESSDTANDSGSDSANSSLAKEKTRVSTISDIAELRKERDTAMTNEDLSMAERKELYKHIGARITDLGNQSSVISFGDQKFTADQFVKVNGDDKLYQVVGLTPEGKLQVAIGKEKPDGGGQTTIAVSDPKDVTPVSDEGKNKYFADRNEELKAKKATSMEGIFTPLLTNLPETSEGTSLASLKAMPTALQELLDKGDKLPAVSQIKTQLADVLTTEQMSSLVNQFSKDPQKFINDLKAIVTGKGLTSTELTESRNIDTALEGVPVDEVKAQRKEAMRQFTAGELANTTTTSAPDFVPELGADPGLYTLKLGDWSPEKGYANQLFGPTGKIYAKNFGNPIKVVTSRYDSLLTPKKEGPKIASSKPIIDMSEEDIAKEKAELAQKIKLAATEGGLTQGELKGLLNRFNELSAAIGQEPVIKLGDEEPDTLPTPEPTQVSAEQIASHISLLSTAPQQVTQEGIAGEDIVKAQVATFESLREESERLGKSYAKLGHYVTVMNPSEELFPVDDRHFNSSVLKDVAAGKAGIMERIRAGRIAVITDKDGNIQYFDTDGNPSTKASGFPVYQNLRGKIVDGQLVLDSKFSGPEHDQTRARLLSLRSIQVPVTMHIAGITRGVIGIPQFTHISLTPDIVVSPYGKAGQFQALDKATGTVMLSSHSPTLSESTLKDDLSAMLDMTKKDGLPEELKDSFANRRSYLEQFILTAPESGKVVGRVRDADGTEKISNTRLTVNDAKQIVTMGGEPVENVLMHIKYGLPGSVVDVYKWDGTKFTKEPMNYDEFLLKNYKVYERKEGGVNSMLHMGEDVAKTYTESIQKEVMPPVVTEVNANDTPARGEFTPVKQRPMITGDASKRQLGKKDGPLPRGKFLTVRATAEQNEAAKVWAKQYLGISGAEFEHLATVANSDAWGQYINGMIRLFADSDYTTFYHEAFHDFTQQFLSRNNKIALYSEAAQSAPGRKLIQAAAQAKKEAGLGALTHMEGFNVLEEALAEDFLKYKTTGKSEFNTPMEKKLFREIVDWHDKIFKVGNPSIDTIYQKLSNLTFTELKRDKNNAFFGALDRAVDGLSADESVKLMRGLDGYIAQLIRESGRNVAELFKDGSTIQKVYHDIFLTLHENYNHYAEEYNQAVADYNTATTAEQTRLLPDLTSLRKLVVNLDFSIENWEAIKAHHLRESEYLQIGSTFIPEELIEDLEPDQKDSIYDDKENQSTKDIAPKQLLYLLASLPKYEFTNGVPELRKNDYLEIFNDITPFDTAWNTLAVTLAGEKDYPTMIKKIKGLLKTNPEYQHLLQSIPSPEIQGSNLSLLDVQLLSQFVGTFSQPLVSLKVINFYRNEQGDLKVIAKAGEAKSLVDLKRDWKDSIQEIENPYRILDTETGQYEVDMDTIADDFGNLSSGGRAKQEKFLAAIGLTFSPKTKNSIEYKELMDSSNTLEKLHSSIKEFVDARNGSTPVSSSLTLGQKETLSKPTLSVIDRISKTLRGRDELYAQYNSAAPVVITGREDLFDELAVLELKYSAKYFLDNVVNSEGNSVYAIRPWSQQTTLYGLLNNPEFATYSDLINDPLGAYFDTAKNPDADNIYVNAVFDMTTGKRRLDRFGKPVTIELYNHNGWNINTRQGEESGEDLGSKTIRLERFEKLVQDISSLLLQGAKEHIRYGDKSTSNGTDTRFSRFVSTSAKQNLWLPVDSSDFKTTYIPVEAAAILKNALTSALRLTNDYFTKGVGKTFDNFDTSLKSKDYWGAFKGLLSTETKQKLIDEGLLTNYIDAPTLTDIIEKHSNSISKDFGIYFEHDINGLRNELSQNPLLQPRDYISSDILKDPRLGTTPEERFETALRSFGINSFIMNLEHVRLMFQDPRFYDNKKGTYKEPFKRFSKASSTGAIAINNDQINGYLNANPRLEREQYNRDHPDAPAPILPETGVEQVAICSDVVITAKDFLDALAKDFPDATDEEVEGFKDAYSKMKVTDAAAFCTLDFYRTWQLRTGTDSYNLDDESVYQTLARGESLTGSPLTDFTFIKPLKTRVAGHVFDPVTQRYVPFDLKQAIIPLIPSLVKGKAFEQIRDNMLRQNVSILTFKTASKHSSITDNGKHNNFYNPDGTVYTGDYTTNPLRVEYMYGVVASPTKYKGKLLFPTQKRALLFLDLFEGGVPMDYTSGNWDTLSHEEKLAASSIYQDEQAYGEAIEKIKDLDQAKLLKSLNTTLQANGNFKISSEDLSKILEREFKSKKQPFNAVKSLEIVNGEFKNALDASLNREAIEQALISIIDTKLRKQKFNGEGLVQSTSIGMEPRGFSRVDSWNSIDGNDLPFYKKEGRILADGTMVTSAMKDKISLQGDFKKLLYHQDVRRLAKEDKISPLDALNILIKNESWLDKSGMREMITHISDKIPIQGTNSMDFAEPRDFLPEIAGPIMIMPTSSVAKSGGDFDWDKGNAVFPSIHYNPYTQELKLYKPTESNGSADTTAIKNAAKLNIEKMKGLNDLRKELNAALEVYKADHDFAKLAKVGLNESTKLLEDEIENLRENVRFLSNSIQMLFEGDLDGPQLRATENMVGTEIHLGEGEFRAAISATVDKINNNINGSNLILTQLKPIMDEAVGTAREEMRYTNSQLKLLGKQVSELRRFNGQLSELEYRNSPRKAYQNAVIAITRRTLERTEMYERLVVPNSTYMFKSTADARRSLQEQGDNSYSNIFTVRENLNQFQSNTAGRSALGIGALANKFFAQLQKAGVTLEPTFVSNTDFGTIGYTSNRLPHNKIKGKTSVSGVYTKNYKGTKYRISDAINQLMNGWVDVAKDDWVFYINAVKEVAPKMLYASMTGVHKDVVQGFFNQPAIYDYLKTLSNYKSDIVKFKDPTLFKQAKARAIYDTLMKWLPDRTAIAHGKKADKTDYAKNLLNTALFIDNNPAYFYGHLNKGMRLLADSNLDMFDPKAFMQFSIPKEASESVRARAQAKSENRKEPEPKYDPLPKPETEDEHLAQALYLIQYLEYEKQQGILDNYRRTLNQDTAKPKNLQDSKERQIAREDMKKVGLISEMHVEKLANNGALRAFTSTSNGLDKFYQHFTANTFEITNHPVFNRFISEEFEKPSQDITQRNYESGLDEIIKKGNNIPFDRRFSIRSDWVKDVKSDFILYLYQNYIYKPNTNQLVSKYVQGMMKYDTALALDLESIKRNYKELVKNNLLLDFLIRDNSRQKVTGGKPKLVSLKLKKDHIDPTTMDVLTEAFQQLYSHPDPVISQFAKKLGHFAFIQSGLSNSDISFSKIIPQDVYGEDMTQIVKAFSDLLTIDPKKARVELDRFYRLFKPNYPQYFESAYIPDQENPGREIPEIRFNKEAKRFKNYLNSNAVDLLSKKANIHVQQKAQAVAAVKTKTSSDTETWTTETAKQHPNNFYVYETNPKLTGQLGSSKVRASKNDKDLAPNTAGIPTMALAKSDGWLSDSTYDANIVKIDAAIDTAMATVLATNPEKILFPADFLQISKLSEKAPKTFAYLAEQLNENFGLNLGYKEVEEALPDNVNEPPLSKESEENDNIKFC